MTNGHGRLVLIVDTDQRFVDDARPLLAAHRVLTARDVGEAREIVLGGRIDLVLLGPAFGSVVAVSEARILVDADPSLQIALAADVVTNRLLKAALKGRFVDVLDLPLNERDLDDVLRNLPSPAAQPTELAFVVEPVRPAPLARAAVAADVEVPESEAVLSAPEGPTEDVAPASEVPDAVSDASIAPVPASEPVSVSTPTMVWFEAEPVAATEVDEIAPAALIEETSPEPQSTESVAAVSDSALAYEDISPTWPPEDTELSALVEDTELPGLVEDTELPGLVEDTELPGLEAPTVEAPLPGDPSVLPEVPEASEQFVPMPPSIPDLLDQVLPSPASVSPPLARIPQEEAPPAHHSARS